MSINDLLIELTDIYLSTTWPSKKRNKMLDSQYHKYTFSHRLFVWDYYASIISRNNACTTLYAWNTRNNPSIVWIRVQCTTRMLLWVIQGCSPLSSIYYYFFARRISWISSAYRKCNCSLQSTITCTALQSTNVLRVESNAPQCKCIQAPTNKLLCTSV